MSRFEIVSTKKGLSEVFGSRYSLIFYLGGGYYQCYPTWRDYLERDREHEVKVSVACLHQQANTECGR